MSMNQSNYPGVLIINKDDSQCMNCGKVAHPRAEFHLPGCGIRFRYMTTHYMVPGVEQRLKKMRPDLEFMGYK